MYAPPMPEGEEYDEETETERQEAWKQYYQAMGQMQMGQQTPPAGNLSTSAQPQAQYSMESPMNAAMYHSQTYAGSEASVYHEVPTPVAKGRSSRSKMKGLGAPSVASTAASSPIGLPTPHFQGYSTPEGCMYPLVLLERFRPRYPRANFDHSVQILPTTLHLDIIPDPLSRHIKEVLLQ